ncbi:MAG: ATP-dependent helicase [Actinobacteria bacterium]|nr:ATP-dependent helicase [Thermoleophilia bacterium]MCB9010227.1 ATP-dependent helicase [Actinomycetota bacterium]
MLDDLTLPQRRAVTHQRGPMMVIAGAGAGKTRVLCSRLAWLVDQGEDPARVLAVTFTRQAAEELRGRAEDLLGRSHETLRVSTFHSWAQDVVRHHGLERGLVAPRRPADQEVRKMLLLDHLGDLDLRLHRIKGDLGFLVDDFVTRIDRCRDELVGARDYLDWATSAVQEARSAAEETRARRELEFARVFDAHDSLLAEEGLEDFGMSIVRALELVREHHDIREAVRHEAQHVMVDEFQDTNHAQTELLMAVMDPAGSLVVVGDDDQGIYRFRGASGKNMADFRRAFPDAPEVRLEVNYRSTQAILDGAGAVVAPIPERAPKHLLARPDASGPPPRFWVAADPAAQARAVAEEVRRLAEEGVPYEEQAILMRAVRLESGPIVRALEVAGIPHQVRGGVGLMERREVRTAIAWLRAAVDPTDGQAHLRILAAPEIEAPWNAVAAAVAAHRKGPVSEAVIAAIADAGGSDRFATLLAEVGRAAAEDPPATAIRTVLDTTGLRAAAIAAGSAEGASRLAALAALERVVVELADARPDLSTSDLAVLLWSLAEMGYRGDPGTPAERRGVQVMTVHQAKGLEFDAVFVVGFTHAGWPGRNRPGPDIPDALIPESIPRDAGAHDAESRRLAYVAMTRARKHLTLCWTAASDGGVPQRVSHFAEESMDALGGVSPEEVGGGPEPGLLDAIGRARDALETATMAAAREPDRQELRDAVAAAAQGLVQARADALHPLPPPPAPASPPRIARPGVSTSVTGIARYRSCPLQYRYAHVDHVPPRPDPTREVGVAAHSALQAHMYPGSPEPDANAIHARFAAELRHHGVQDTAQAKHALALAAESFPKLVRRTLASGVSPVAVERPFTLALGPHRVRGRIDRVDRSPDGGYALVDYKTGSPPKAGADHEGRFVLRLYLAGVREAWEVEPTRAILEYVLEDDTRREHPEAEEMAIALDEARATLDDIAAERFEPTPGWSCRTCDYRLLCPAVDR